MKISDIKSKVNESLPPHLAKFVGDDGNLTPDAQARVDAGRKKRAKGKFKDVTPKGYGPVDEGDVDNGSWEVTMPINNPDVVGQKIYNDANDAGLDYDDIGWTDDEWGDGTLSADFSDEDSAKRFSRFLRHYKHSTKNEYPTITKIVDDINEAATNSQTFLLKIMRNSDGAEKYATVNYPDAPGNNPIFLAKTLRQAPAVQAIRKEGFDGPAKTVATWHGDLDAELADARDKLGSGKNWIDSYKRELENKVKTLTVAQKIMGSGKVLDESLPAAKPVNKQVGDTIKSRNIRTKRSRTERVTGVSKDQHGHNQYELSSGRIVYDQDIEEAGGDEIVAYHGSPVKFDQFNTPEIFVAKSPKEALRYGSNLYTVTFRNPKFTTDTIYVVGSEDIINIEPYSESTVDETVKEPYAVGMAQAMKSTGDEPPLKKSTIKKAHKIAKAVDEDVTPMRHKLKAGDVVHLKKDNIDMRLTSDPKNDQTLGPDKGIWYAKAELADGSKKNMWVRLARGSYTVVSKGK